ncbi:unnamed protein product [Rotaria sp. Silwood1]|nr:unnamed protein product [Rotaria sp. Silwood1]CAF1283056.1 unnamed protein product [Rotaria sp. Silwood1]CAF3503007.1 unnamed protein product [Rotaria sp. Silwood1]CAF4677999.1 unnamed protein product [Rotaria sp. Silwood1]
MAMDLTCLSIHPPLPTVPIITNDSNRIVHPTYKPISGSISQMISASMARSTFSIHDVRSLLKRFFKQNFNSWNFSEITKTKPIPSAIIYTSIALALFLILSIMFCILSCCHFKKHQEKKRQQSKSSRISRYLLIIIYLLGIADMIYVAYRVNETKYSIDNTIKEVNQDIYPKEISEHIKYLNRQLENLDQYFIQTNSILINASKSMLINAFDEILQEKYFLDNIVQTVNNVDNNIRKLQDIINTESTLSPLAIQTFKNIQEQYQNMINYLEIPLKEICKYANGTQTDIDMKLLDVLNLVHDKLIKAINSINNDILSQITPWQNNMLIKKDLEEQIRKYINLVGIIFLVLVIILGMIPVSFLIFIIIYRLCNRNDYESNKNNRNRIQMNNMVGGSDTSSMDSYPNKQRYDPHNSVSKNIPINHHRYRSKSETMSSNNNGSSGILLCVMRIAFVIIIIILIAMILLTGVYYAVDLVVQGACRTVHDDQPFLINFIIDKLIESNIMPYYTSEINRTVTDVVSDCRNHIHFSKKIFENYWSVLDDDVKDMMNTLSEHVFNQFIQSIGDIDISSDRSLLIQLINQANRSDVSVIAQDIDKNLITMNKFFGNISNSNATLSPNLVHSTIDEFKNYVKKVLESTLDSCPLPLAIIYKTDKLICHKMGSSLNGLWLNVFFFMFIVTVGFSIFGICVYKRLN